MFVLVSNLCGAFNHCDAEDSSMLCGELHHFSLVTKLVHRLKLNAYGATRWYMVNVFKLMNFKREVVSLAAQTRSKRRQTKQ